MFLDACRRKSLLSSAVAGLIALGAGAAQASDPTYRFNIPAESLSQALTDFSQTSAQQIIYSEDLVRGRKSGGLHGDYSSIEALKVLLAGTDLKVEINAAGVLMVQSKNAQAASNEGAGEAGLLAPETVIVTGSRLPDTEPASPVTTIDRQFILNSGYSNTGDLIRSLPQNFSGGVNPGVIAAPGSNNQFNITGAASFNLRGLGADSTLTLIDGHRFANDAAGGAVDVSMVPLSAIDRIEVVTDGASAIYGSDAVAGVANFILRKDFDGAETSVRYGGATDGGAEDQLYNQTFGKSWSTGNALVSYEYDRSSPLFANERSFSSKAENPYSLLPLQNRNSVFAVVNQNLSPDVSVYAEGLYTSRYKWGTQTEFGTTYSGTENVGQYGISAGGQAQLLGDWVAYLDGTYSNDRDTAADSVSTFIYDNSLKSIEGHATGTLVTLPTGPVRVAVGGGYRFESYSDSDNGRASRSVTYAYAEASVPLVDHSDARIGLERLDLDLAGRVEKYSDFGETANPRIGLIYGPTEDLNLRGTWGTSFHAPSFLEQYGQTQLYLDPGIWYGVSAPNAVVMLQAGPNPELQPEKSTAWTVGSDYTPSKFPGLKVSATYFDIGYKGRITTPLANSLVALSNPIYAPYVVQNPSATLQSSLISGAQLYRNFSGSPYDPSHVIALVNNSYQNVSQQMVDGVDLEIDYTWQSDLGNFTVGGDGSWLRLQQMLLPTTPSQRLSGTVFNPPTWKGRLNASWSNDAWVVSAALNYVGSEIDNTIGSSNFTSSSLTQNVSSWTTVDMQVAYHTPTGAGLLSGLRLALSVQNLFDADPPFLESTSTLDPDLNYDSTNASPLGRFVSISLTKDW